MYLIELIENDVVVHKEEVLRITVDSDYDYVESVCKTILNDYFSDFDYDNDLNERDDINGVKVLNRISSYKPKLTNERASFLYNQNNLYCDGNTGVVYVDFEVIHNGN